MKKLTQIGLCAVFMTLCLNAFGQRYLTREGQIKFYSHAPMEDITAHNNKVLSIIDIEKGQVAVDMLIKAFEFEKKLMQEHFNENYLESDEFPKATFKGTFEVPEGLTEMKPGSYDVAVSGDLTIHGVTQALTENITLTVEGESISTHFVFNVKVKDHDIKIPKLVVKNIAEEIEVTADFNYKPFDR